MTTTVKPVATSCHIHMDVIVAMAVPTKRPGGVVSSGGRSIVMRGVLSPHKDLAISAKLGGGVYFCVTGLPDFFHPLGEDIWHTSLLAGNS